jgi:hypothetical protein
VSCRYGVYLDGSSQDNKKCKDSRRLLEVGGPGQVNKRQGKPLSRKLAELTETLGDFRRGDLREVCAKETTSPYPCPWVIAPEVALGKQNVDTAKYLADTADKTVLEVIKKAAAGLRK